MADEPRMKKSFVLYADQREVIEDLSLEEKGMILDALFEFVATGVVPVIENKMVLMAFKMFKVRITHDNEKYNKICEKRKQAIEKRWGIQKYTNEYNCIQVNTNDTDNDKDNEKDNESHVSKETMRDINNIPPMPPKGGDVPTWKKDKTVYDAMLDEAKEKVMADEEYRKRKEELHDGIDFEKTIENCYDYWKSETGYKKCKDARAKNINLVQRLKTSFDKGKIYKSKRSHRYEGGEASLQERHTAFVQWLAGRVNDPNSAMPVFHVTLDDFAEMLSKCNGDANAMARTVVDVIKKGVTKEDGLIGAFRKYMER